MQTTRRRTSAALVLAATAALASIQPASADKIGTVSPEEAAAQLLNGMPSDMTPAAADEALDTLTVATGSDSGYNRDLFPHWSDASDYGWPVEPSDSCDARDAALYRDGENVTMTDSCTELDGTWVDPYGAGKYDATGDIDIDHMVPLANAWRSGADDWTTDERETYANDPLVLVASDDSLNQSKGDSGPEEWRPPVEESHCNYAVRWTFVKEKYDLTITASEKSTLNSMLAGC